MLRPLLIESVPHETARVARAAFPKGYWDLRLADELDTLFTADALLALFPTHRQPARPPWRLVFVGCAKWPQSRSCSGCESKTIGGTVRSCTGARRTTAHRRCGSSAHPSRG